jgi:SrtB family sortase
MLRLNQEWINPQTASPKIVKEALLNAYYKHQTCYMLFDDESNLTIEDLYHIYGSITHWAKRHGMNVTLVVETGFLYRLFQTFDESVLSFLEVTNLKKVWTLSEEDLIEINRQSPSSLTPLLLNKRKILSISIQIISIVLIGTGLIIATLNYLERLAHEELVQKLQTLHQEATQPDLIETPQQDSLSLFQSMKSLNRDYIGWIRIGSSEMSFPMVKGKDNQFYLNMGFDLRPSSYGSIFMDYRNVDLNDTHIIVYGHSVKHTAMFGKLIRYEDKNFLNQHQLITIADENFEYTYKVFSFQRIDANKTRLSLPLSSQSLESVMQSYASNSVHQPAQFEVTQLLTLVSCEYSYDNGRVFVHAYLVSKEHITNKE